MKLPASDQLSYFYPFRAIVLFAAALALALIWLVLPVERMWTFTFLIGGVALALIGWRTYSLVRLRRQQQGTLGAVDLRLAMPLVLLVGDCLPMLFGQEQVHVGDGAIWLRVDQVSDLPRFALALKRRGRPPEGVVLAVAPAQHPNDLTQSLRRVRQAMADASRLVGRRLPAYIAMYQRLTMDPLAQWYGVSSATRGINIERFEPVIRAAELQRDDHSAITRAAALASIIKWTQRVVIGTLTDQQHPSAPCALFGVGWIDCGPASGSDNPWTREVEQQTQVAPVTLTASSIPWPQPLIKAMPKRRQKLPRLTACAHALTLLACAAIVAFWGATKNNQMLLTRLDASLNRYSMIPAEHDAMKREALATLISERDQLDQFERHIPLRLSFGMYRGARIMPVLNDAIASYAPPVPPPMVIALESMSLFDSGKAQLKPGSTRAMVGAVEMIKAHPGKRIIVAGHTDNVGSSNSNLKLSVSRAQAVRDWLVEASGIEATQFAIQGYGHTQPIAQNNTPDGRARNRRVEITLVPE